jgi:hypothetical protein
VVAPGNTRKTIALGKPFSFQMAPDNCGLTRRALLASQFAAKLVTARDWDVETTQLTHGPRHHFFGFIKKA